jgi:tRNA pseudouridine55 synthase
MLKTPTKLSFWPGEKPKQINLIDADSLDVATREHFAEGAIVLVDKPDGRTSFWAVKRIRWLCQVKKVGHAGTLDPFATGLLIILTGPATRLQDIIMRGDKHYRAELFLGRTSDTLDRTGEIRSMDLKECPFNETELSDALLTFTGRIQQIPPMYSAIKIQGERLYKKARRGVVIDRPPRDVEIHSIEIIEFKWPRLVIDIKCSKGTYIRTLADDIGQKLGCGALVQELERCGSGEFSLEKAIQLDDIEETMNKKYEVDG